GRVNSLVILVLACFVAGCVAASSSYSVTDFGAKGDGVTDDTKLLSLLFCSRAQVAGLRLISSPQMHLVVGFSSAVRITGLTITAPGDSLNTDGVHIEQSRDILIDTYRLVCVSSIGSLGMANSLAQVSDIQVDHCNVFSTMNGVRIKTWQASFPSSPLLQPKE
ncbi:hypothetical protein BHM03_00060954, partial [Ensete ventricosum]